MTVHVSFKILVAAAIATVGTSYSCAETSAKTNGCIAGGIIMTPDYEGSGDYTVSPLIAGRINYDKYYIEVRGADLRANISPDSEIEFGPILSYRGGRDDNVENTTVSRLRTIDGAVEGGAFIKIPFHNILSGNDELALNANILADISNTHDGFLISFGPSYSFELTRKLRLGISASATYVSENYNQIYFGIDADNAARSGLTQYKADAGIKDAGIMIKADYMINAHWGIIGITGCKKLLGDAADSPITDQEGSNTQFTLGAGLSYSF